MPKKSKPEVSLGATVRLKTQSGEIIRDRPFTCGRKNSAELRLAILSTTFPQVCCWTAAKRNQIVETVSCFDLSQLLSPVRERRFLRLQGPLQSFSTRQALPTGRPVSRRSRPRRWRQSRLKHTHNENKILVTTHITVCANRPRFWTTFGPRIL
jgi:hypothetical protein